MSKNFTKVNFQIKCPAVRVSKDGAQLGVISTDQARQMAFDDGLDLVETVANANPPVCIITNFDKYRYEKKMKEKEQQKKQRQSQKLLKEVRFGPHTSDHDIGFKLTSIKNFLSEGKDVQLILQFKSREIAFKEEGFLVISKVLKGLGEKFKISSPPKLQGKKIVCRIDA